MSHSTYNIRSVAEIVQGTIVQLFCNNQVRDLSIDSRKVQHSDSVLFFALKGPRNDGHQFIHDLYNKGVRNFVVSETDENIDRLQGANIIRVNDTRKALQRLAAHHRAKFNLTTIGITGSNGKTIVKEWLYQILQSSFRIVRSPKSFNSQVGVPLSIWKIEAEDNLGLFEAGISSPGEMDQLQQIIQPQIGVFINLREAHDANFSSREEKAYEKLQLFKNCNTLIYNCDYNEIEAAIENSPWLNDVKKIRCSFIDPSADFYVSDVNKQRQATHFKVNHKNKELPVSIPFNDSGSIENTLFTLATALQVQSTVENILHSLKRLQPVAMRLQLLEGINRCGIINDSYNSDLGSLEIALDFALQQQHLKKRTLILSDILQSGKPSAELYQKVADLCQQKQIDRLIGIGPEISKHRDIFTIPATFYPDTSTFLAHFRADEFSEELVLIKGARSFQFEKISHLLEKKSHETIFEINLDALVENLNFFRSRISTNTGVMAMVKAFSYGMGSAELAHLLSYNKVSYLAVAYGDEGVELRKAGVKLPIMVMNPEASGYDTLIRNQLEPEIFSIRTLKAFIAANKTIKPDEPQSIHLKIDSGMHRLGFENQDIDELIKLLKENPVVHIATVFTHLAASDDPAHDDFTHLQVSRFNEITLRLQKELGQSLVRHVLNSTGILRFPEYQFELVRLGIGLYGYAGVSGSEQLSPSSRLKTVISQIKLIDAGESVGYQRAGNITEPSRTATIPIGYADGFSRKLGNGVGEVAINGHRAKTIGNICMDMCMIDISDIPCQEGDEVEIFGSHIPLQEVAEKMETIPYEVISGISRRVKRIYFHE